VAAWIHDPNSGDTLMAEQGGGVWMRGKKMRLADRSNTDPGVGLVGGRVKKMLGDEAIMPHGADLPRVEVGSCASFDYGRLFVGDANFGNSKKTRANFLFYRHTNAWDHVPGLFLHQELGGYSANWNGKAYDMRDMRSGLISAHDREDWERLRQQFDPLITYLLRML
jgi:fructose-1,6-bisphosphatase/inositol monophosphatase family enzyme